jgi:hypothetical protein
MEIVGIDLGHRIGPVYSAGRRVPQCVASNRKITHEEGIEAFYKGLPPTVIGLVPYCAAAYYFVYDNLTCSYHHSSNKNQLGNLQTLAFGAFTRCKQFHLSLSLCLQTSSYNPKPYFFHIYETG